MILLVSACEVAFLDFVDGQKLGAGSLVFLTSQIITAGAWKHPSLTLIFMVGCGIKNSSTTTGTLRVILTSHVVRNVGQ